MDAIRRERDRRKRHERVRRRVYGTPARPRLNVYRSLSHIYAQIIDDSAGRTLVSASSRDKELEESLKTGGNLAAASAVGRLLAERARQANLAAVVFDRGGYRYHGRVKALAEACRAGGLKF
jgi:large subunit ribosomal protein L18